MIEIRKITTDIFIGILDLKAFSILNNIQIKRDQEKAGSQFVLQKLMRGDDFKLAYNSENKPFLEDAALHISISHSHDKLVIILNHRESTGIDIELIRDKVQKIRHKFLNDNEMMFAQNNTEKLITIWAAKEAMYKCYGLKNLDFKTNLFVEDFDNDYFFGKIETTGFKKRLMLAKEKIEDYMLVYILKELAD